MSLSQGTFSWTLSSVTLFQTDFNAGKSIHVICIIGPWSAVVLALTFRGWLLKCCLVAFQSRHCPAALVCSVFQLKNATTVLEYEKIAEVDFEKRDFRKVRLTFVLWSYLKTAVFDMAQVGVWLFPGWVLGRCCATSVGAGLAGELCQLWKWQSSCSLSTDQITSEEVTGSGQPSVTVCFAG